MTVNKIRVRNLAEAGLSHAVVLEKILSNQPKMLSAILIGNNIVNISASSLMTVLVTDVLGNKYVGIGTEDFRDDLFRDPVTQVRETDLPDHAGPDTADRGR